MLSCIPKAPKFWSAPACLTALLLRKLQSVKETVPLPVRPTAPAAVVAELDMKSVAFAMSPPATYKAPPVSAEFDSKTQPSSSSRADSSLT